jgi:asparagine N-glycosylation enzyme membrane subunit Stt3
MPTTTDYTTFAMQELLAEEAKVKKLRMIWAFILGGFLGIILLAAVGNASLVNVLVLFVVFGFFGNGGKKNEDKYKAIQAEISSRNLQQ